MDRRLAAKNLGGRVAIHPLAARTQHGSVLRRMHRGANDSAAGSAPRGDVFSLQLAHGGGASDRGSGWVTNRRLVSERITAAG
ncbi:MAG: hypothetical protein QOF51_139, partial [Chloroflexota bacterium]|nr:hypothetical protein [Chloroflexota bacterium]